MGWNEEEEDPKKTFDFVIRYFESGAVDGYVRFLQELTSIRRENFDSVEAYYNCVGYLRDRLDSTVHFKMLTELTYV